MTRPKDHEYYDMQNRDRSRGTTQVFIEASYQRGHGISNFLEGLIQKNVSLPK